MKAFACALLLALAGSGSALGQAVPAQVGEQDATRIGRATLLAVHLEDMERRADVLPWGIGIAMAAGAAGVTAGVLVEDLTGRAGFIAGGAVMLGGGVASLVASEELRGPLAGSAYFGGIGLLALGVGLDNRDFLVPGIAFAAGHGSSAALMLISAAIRPQTPASQLARDYERLRDPKLRARLTEAEVAAVEERYRLLEPAIDPRIMFAPMLVGNAVAAVALMERAATDEGRATVGALMLGVGVVWPVLVMLQPYDFEAYVLELEHAGITLSATPTLGGASVSGTF